MIRYAITTSDLRSRITAADATWFADGVTALAGLPAQPTSSDFLPLWGRVKQVYMDLQCSKCCFCEKPLEGKIEQDVEHFRPKTEVKPWTIPAALVAEGVTVRQPAQGSVEPGYYRLAYEPFNYAMACKTCNSTLKGNFFPVEGTRATTSTDPTTMASERALLIYPIGSVDHNPEALISFRGLSPVPRHKSGFKRRRALVTIAVFRLDDTERRTLYKCRAYLVRELFLELEGRRKTNKAAKKQEHQEFIDILTADTSPFTNCLRAFVELYAADRIQAILIARECAKYLKTKSVPT